MHTGDVAWVERNIIAQIPAEVMQTEGLQKAIEKLRLVNQLQSLDASSLDPTEVFEIFKLQDRPDIEYEFADKETCAVPSELESIFEKYQSGVSTSSGPTKVTLSRCFINLVIFYSVLEERASIQNAKPKEAAISFSSTSEPLTTPIRKDPKNTKQSLIQTPRDTNVFFETELKQSVTWKGEQRLLHGFADYYHSGTASGNLVVVEAKRRFQLGQAYGQLLAYMGMIHHARKNEEKNHTIIYGVATDGFMYHFWRIDEKSIVTSSRTYDWFKKSEREHIYSIFRVIIRTAMLSSPTTSPIKGQQFAEIFRTAGHSKLDFGVIDKLKDSIFWPDETSSEGIELSDID